MKLTRIVLVFVLVASLAGCAGMSATQQRMLSGGAIGTAAGGVGGYVVDQVER